MNVRFVPGLCSVYIGYSGNSNCTSSCACSTTQFASTNHSSPQSFESVQKRVIEAADIHSLKECNGDEHAIQKHWSAQMSSKEDEIDRKATG